MPGRVAGPGEEDNGMLFKNFLGGVSGYFPSFFVSSSPPPRGGPPPGAPPPSPPPGPRPPEELLPRVLPDRRRPQVLQRGARLVVQLLRDGHLDGDEQRARLPVLAPDAASGDAEHPAVGRARRYVDGHRRPAMGRHLDVGAERELGDSHRHGYRQLADGAAEHGVRPDVPPDVQVARLPAVLAGSPPARDPDPLAVGDASGDPRLDSPRAH